MRAQCLIPFLYEYESIFRVKSNIRVIAVGKEARLKEALLYQGAAIYFVSV